MLAGRLYGRFALQPYLFLLILFSSIIDGFAGEVVPKPIDGSGFLGGVDQRVHDDLIPSRVDNLLNEQLIGYPKLVLPDDMGKQFALGFLNGEGQHVFFAGSLGKLSLGFHRM